MKKIVFTILESILWLIFSAEGYYYYLNDFAVIKKELFFGIIIFLINIICLFKNNLKKDETNSSIIKKVYKYVDSLIIGILISLIVLLIKNNGYIYLKYFIEIVSDSFFIILTAYGHSKVLLNNSKIEGEEISLKKRILVCFIMSIVSGFLWRPRI